MKQPGTRQMVGPFGTDGAAADDAYVQSVSPQSRPRSPGTMRRRL